MNSAASKVGAVTLKKSIPWVAADRSETGVESRHMSDASGEDAWLFAELAALA